MVRNLDAQARVIWPQEAALFGRYELPDEPDILDAGCGTGEISSRIAVLYPRARVLGVDIVNEHLARAGKRYAALAPRLRFERQSIFSLDAPGASFDLTLCRHVLHSIPQIDRALRELVRVTRPGGYLHLIPEDYGMLHFAVTQPDPGDFWHAAPRQFGRATGTDLFAGRHIYGLLRELSLQEIAIEYVVVDTLRADRDTFAQILEAWRDGYTAAIAEYTEFDESSARAYFERMIADVRDPDAYAVWMVPVVSARVRA
jgi:ubiquinone/menaquinone biosynthesis C-methylase UbiE